MGKQLTSSVSRIAVGSSGVDGEDLQPPLPQGFDNSEVHGVYLTTL